MMSEGSIRINPEEGGHISSMDWINLVEYSDQWQALMNTAMNLFKFQNRTFLTSWAYYLSAS